MVNITVGVLTISDRCFRGEAEDTSGPGIKSMLERGVIKNCTVVKTHLVPDKAGDIEEVLREWSDESVNLILTTGGTGVASTDVTPQATTAVLHTIIPGISQLMFKKSSEVTPLAALSRGVAGIRKKSLIVNLPGSRKASGECLQAIAGVIPHAIHLILGRKTYVENVHSSLEQKHSSVKASDPARRKTVSPYDRIPVSQAQDIVLQSVFLMKKDAVVNYKEALGHIVAEDVASRVNLPPFDVSLKDGYAICSNDKSDTRTVIGDSKAGELPSGEVVPPECCVRISTGAAMFPGTDAVVMVEETAPILSTEDNKEKIKLLGTLPSRGQDVRKKGSDFRVGNLLIPFKSYLDASAVGLCVAGGVTSMKVFKKPLVAVMSTGDELIDPEEPASPGKVCDSNRITLISLLKEHGFESLDCGIVKDEPDALRDALERAFREADVVVSTGSMSMGERDYLKDVLVEDFSAEIRFGRVMMKPGLPTTYATAFFDEKMKMFFGLPGNPASAFVTSHLFLLPALRKISGYDKVLPTAISVAVSEDEYVPLEDRPHYVRGFLKPPWTNGCLARVTGDQRSSRISSCVQANCLLLFPPKSSPPPQTPEPGAQASDQTAKPGVEISRTPVFGFGRSETTKRPMPFGTFEANFLKQDSRSGILGTGSPQLSQNTPRASFKSVTALLIGEFTFRA